jgi:hypothetical protein
VIQEILRKTDPKFTQDRYVVIKSNATTKAMLKVDVGGLSKRGERAAHDCNAAAEDLGIL